MSQALEPSARQISGDTYPLKEELKSRFGGRWEPQTKAWLVPTQHRVAVEGLAQQHELTVEEVDVSIFVRRRWKGRRPKTRRPEPATTTQKEQQQKRPARTAATKEPEPAASPIPEQQASRDVDTTPDTPPTADTKQSWLIPVEHLVDPAADAHRENPSELPAKKLREMVQLADDVYTHIEEGKGVPNNRGLTTLANAAFGGTRGEGKYTPKDAYDALELGVNRWIKDNGARLMAQSNGHEVLAELRELLTKLPRQTDRTQETIEMQQFSTPPTHAFVATKALGLRDGDVVLEPSAGVGGLAVFAQAQGATVNVNEIAPRRTALLRELGFNPTSIDGEFLHDLMPEDAERPTAILMNPPFSATGGRVKAHKSKFGAKHVDQALQRLEEGGRLVAIVGQGMVIEGTVERVGNGRHATGALFRDWWETTAANYNVRANIRLPGDEYGKYGTTLDNQLLVIDKTGPTPGATFSERILNIRTGRVANLEEALDVIRPIAAERQEQRDNLARDHGSLRTDLRRAAAEAPRGRVVDGFRRGERGRGVDDHRAVLTGPEDHAVPAEKPTPRPRKNRGSGSLRRGRGRTEDAVGSVEQPQASEPEISTTAAAKTTEAPVLRQDEEGGTFVRYAPAKLSSEGLRTHPANIVEAASMAAVDPPDITYRSSLPTEIEAGGVGAMEMVARELKALGMYSARTISFEGVDYRETVHTLTPEQRQMYDAAARAWQSVLKNFDAALTTTDASERARTFAVERFWSAEQRFFRQLTTALKVPSAIRETEQAIAEGKSVVIGLIGTGDSRTGAKVSQAIAEGKTLDNLDFTPREAIAQLVNRSFPTTQYVERTDENGKTTKVKLEVARRGADRTDAATGMVEPTTVMTTPKKVDAERVSAAEFGVKFEKIGPPEAKVWWDEAVAKIPPLETEQLHVIGGAILPIWQRLKTTDAQRLRFVRATTDDGRRVVGIHIPKDHVGKILEAVGITRSLKSPEEVFRGVGVEGGRVELVGGPVQKGNYDLRRGLKARILDEYRERGPAREAAVPEKAPEQAAPQPTSIIVKGDTFHHKGSLKSMGGKWDKENKGWVVPNPSDEDRSVLAVAAEKNGWTLEPVAGNAPEPAKSPMADVANVVRSPEAAAPQR